jgi:hypothetical protein
MIVQVFREKPGDSGIEDWLLPPGDIREMATRALLASFNNSRFRDRPCRAQVIDARGNAVLQLEATGSQTAATPSTPWKFS